MKFGTKAGTLESIARVLSAGSVLPLERITLCDWRAAKGPVLARVRKAAWAANPMIVRSSAKGEDASGKSQAGRYLSIANVSGDAALAAAVDRVFASYGGAAPDAEVFVQPLIERAAMSGVAFSRDCGTGGAYFVINYDDCSGSTDSVTSGRGEQLKTFYWHRGAPHDPPPRLARVIGLLRELEQLLECDALDVEFALTPQDELVLLQVRPLANDALQEAAAGPERAMLEQVRSGLAARLGPHPYLHGTRTVFGVMPDWNPAEIIGVRPRPLALSLYKELVTDSIWAYQRDNYGYRNLRSFPLMVSFGGLPYIDVRVSFNSFIPADIEPGLSERLVNYYVDRLIASPSHHDKVEFEIIFSCYTLDLPQRLAVLQEHGFSEADRAEFAASLRRLTNGIIHSETGLWRGDIDRIHELASRRATILASPLDPVAKIYWLIEDCKRYGTLPFAGLARAGFIAVQLLRSLVSTGIFTARDYERFLSSLDTVSSRMGRDFGSLDRGAFLERYGHLRPGTYDILSPRYDEAPERYFDWTSRKPVVASAPGKLALSPAQLRATERMLAQHGLQHDAPGLFDFIKAAIEGREYAKFVFTRSLSDALRLVRELGEGCGFSADDCSYADARVFAQLYASSESAAQALAASIGEGKRRYAVTRQLALPPLIVSADDVWGFHLPPSDPNFVTTKRASGPVCFVAEPAHAHLRGAILMIPSADPGYDWIFSRGIAGFITMYGGVNSHMAIRAGELGIPAVVGAGEAYYGAWSAARALEIDCAARQVRMLR